MSFKRLIKRILTFVFHPSTLVFFNNFRGTIIYPSVVLKNPSMMKIRNSVITRGCSLKCFKTDCDEKKYLVIENSYIGDRCYISSGGTLEIVNSTFAPEVFVGSYKHGMNPMEHFNSGNSHYSIRIHNSFLGQKVSVVGDIEIGKHSFVGAGSVVTKSLPEYSLAVGNPARVIKVFDPDVDDWVPLQGK